MILIFFLQAADSIIGNLTKSSSWGAVLFFSVLHVLWKATNIFSILLVLGLGQKLLSCYKSMSSEILCKLSLLQGKQEYWVKSKQKSVVTIENGEPLQELVQLFETSRECFSIYNKLVGFIVLVSVLESSILCIVCIYDGIENEGKSQIWIYENMIRGMSYFLRLFLFGHVGQAMKDAVSLCAKLNLW
jgi:hypothetical protein